VYLTGGTTGTDFTGEVLALTPATKGWARLPPLRHPRRAHAALALPGGFLLVAGGADSLGELRSVELLDLARDRFMARKRAEAAAAVDGKVARYVNLSRYLRRNTEKCFLKSLL